MSRPRRALRPLGILLVVAVAVAMSTCHPLVNPLDPQSTTFTGEVVLRDPLSPVPVLPAVEQWAIVAEHSPGQFLGLEVPDVEYGEPDFFIDSRRPASPPELYIALIFEEPVSEADLENALILVGERIPGSTSVFSYPVDAVILDPARRQLVLTADAADEPSTIRIALIDSTGVMISERTFGLLPGDVTSDGVVDFDDLNAGPLSLDGALPSDSLPRSIRADIDANGLIEGAGPDADLINLSPPPNGFAGETLPGPPPSFDGSGTGTGPGSPGLPTTIYAGHNIGLNGFIYRFADMAGTAQVVYDGAAGTAFGSPDGIYVDESDGDRIYIADSNEDLIYRIDDVSGAGQIEYDGTAVGGFASGSGGPRDIALDASGRIYVADWEGWLYRFDDISGTGAVTYSGGGLPFMSPGNLAFDSLGRIYVTDWGNNVVYRFDDMSGANQVTYDGSAGTPFGNLRGVAIDSSDRIYLVDTGSDLLYRIDDMSGAGQVEYDGGATPFSNPSDVFIGPHGRIYVADNLNSLLYRMDDVFGTNQVTYDGGGSPFNSLHTVYVTD